MGMQSNPLRLQVSLPQPLSTSRPASPQPTFTQLYLSQWTDATTEGAPRDVQQHSLYVYIALGCVSEALSAAQTILLTLCSLRASRRIHRLIASRLLHAPLAFFDATSTGAILNRFLSDVQNIDQVVPDSLLSLATQVRSPAVHGRPSISPRPPRLPVTTLHA